MSSPLTPGEFGSFFKAVNHGHEPFPWQARLVKLISTRLADSAHEGPFWPALVDLPTGTGKSSLVDIALFLLALEAEQPPQMRRLPRRIVFVVDRRVIVDQAHRHGQMLMAELTSASNGIVARVANGLRSYTGHDGSPPLAATVLRGGIARDESWARRPDIPAVISSTVDQVGSRLLFRGYGLSRGMRPIHAGLLGTDTLFLLDEVHLARPFAQTLDELAKDYQRNWATVDIHARWELTQLSATPGAGAEDVFRLDEDDKDPDKAPILVRRLSASKPATLHKVKVSAKDEMAANTALAVACADEVQRLLREPHLRTIGVVLNRVDRARSTYQELKSRLGVSVELMTGRMRACDRDALVDRLAPRLATGRQRLDSDDPLVVVATQCIEAGADFDFDGLVTECASMDSLLQRFGRLDRDGRLSNAGTPAVGVIIARSTEIAKGSDDPIYGKALARTWAVLEELPDVDFGHGRFPERLRRDPELAAPTEPWPVLFPAHLDAWVQTNPTPDPDPDPAQWLHGLNQPNRDVTIVWRADLCAGMLDKASREPAWLDDVRSLVAAIPPAATESMTVPVTAVRRWLEGDDPVSLSDVDGRGEDQNDDVLGNRGGRPVVCWDGDDTSVILPTVLRPGQTLIVPTEYGGIGKHGSWDPEASDPVSDVAETAQLRLRRRPVLRLVPGVLPGDVELVDPEAEPETGGRELVSRWLAEQVERLDERAWSKAGADLRTTVRALASLPLRALTVEQVRVVASGTRPVSGFVVTGRRLIDLAGFELDDRNGVEPDSVDSEPETSSFTAVPVLLADHLDGVGEWARRLATNCGLDQRFIEDLTLAGRLHDAGKADPRFQVALHGDEVSFALNGELLAKSATPENDIKARRNAQQRARYPRGTRHELMTLALIQDVDGLQQPGADWDLVCHLVASHHGWCRPFAPAVLDEEPVKVALDLDGIALQGNSDHGLDRLDQGVAERFWRMVRRYGWFRLAWLEAILRLADHRRSEAEQHDVMAHEEKIGGNKR